MKTFHFIAEREVSYRERVKFSITLPDFADYESALSLAYRQARLDADLQWASEDDKTEVSIKSVWSDTPDVQP